jgi:protein-arginine kinase activator protein McsA
VDLELMKKNPKRFVIEKKRQMDSAVKILDFETAAILRDEIRELEKLANKPKSFSASKPRKTKGK